MKKSSIATITCSIILSVIIGFIIGIKYSNINIVQPYKDYYYATEALLDTLEYYYNWVDGFDPYGYYEAVENLK